MKKVFAIVALLISFNVFAADVSITETNKVSCDAIMQSGDKEKLAQSGCCSWHQGVCGCSNGRAACCDGSLSPSCGCNSIVPIEEAKSEGIKL